MTPRTDHPDRGRTHPPRLATALLRRRCSVRRLEEVEGDLEEVFSRDLAHRGRGWAQVVYWKEVLLFVLWQARRRESAYEQVWGPIMLKNYVIVALRNLRRQKIYAGINIVGLALGIACCVLLLSLVRHERSYDQFHTKADRIYRVLVATQEQRPGYAMPAPPGPALDQAIPEIEHAVRFQSGSAVVRYQDKLFSETVLFADPAFLEMFTFPLRQGDPAHALEAPNHIVISAAMAEKYFGEEDPIGKPLSVRLGGTTADRQVAGVLAPLLDHSSLVFDFLLPYDNLAQVTGPDFLTSWGDYEGNTFVLLGDASQVPAVEEKFAIIVEAHLGAILKAEGLSASDIRMILQPYTAYHLGPYFGGNGLASRRSPTDLYVLFGIGLAILLIACFNFTTLSLGRSSTRFREVGMRKVLGAGRLQLIRQFFLEALMMSGLALLLGLLLTQALLPTFNSLVGKSLTLGLLEDGRSLVLLLGLMLFISVVGGGYPALVLSRFRPVEVFKGRLKIGGKNRFTKSLVVIQFTLSIGLVIVTLYAAAQLRFIRTMDLGFETEQVVVVPTRARATNAEQGEQLLRFFETELAGHPGIVQVAGASSAFAGGGSSTDVQRGDKTIEVFHYRVDDDFLETMDIELVAGRGFSRDHPGDAAQSVLVNEEFLRRFEMDAPLGQTFSHTSGVIPPEATIIGVFKDIHNLTLFYDMLPVVLHMSPKMPIGYLQVRIRPDQAPASLAALEAAWQKISPDQPFVYAFLDEAIDRRYRTEQNWTRILTASAVLAILIACLGLFGLSALTAERRTKEIGVRKVLGATVLRIVLLLSKDFLLLVGIAFVIATPLAYFVVEAMLQDFAYQIEISWQIFLIAGLTALLVALLTVGYQSIKAAGTNPVKTLRYE